ncbi:MAG: hypothetical protein AB1757_23395 [Acidobacteriota bacterium]
MEREKEIAKLTQVLRRIARSSQYAAWNRNDEATRFCVKQYNAVLTRLTELEPQVAYAFTRLAEGASAEVVRIAARELSAYFEAESEPQQSEWAYQGCWRPRGATTRMHRRC